jgi:tricorn protease
MTSGYYRFPTIHDDTIVFVSEDDLWQVSAAGGMARRLTSNSGSVTYPMLSPDGSKLAFVGREEGFPEVYVMPAQGGVFQRLTYMSSDCRVLGWNSEGTHILFCSNHGQPHHAEYMLYEVSADGPNGSVKELPYGPARSVSFGPNESLVLGRNTGDPARWKRYRGGTAGQLWIDNNGDGDFQRFLPALQGNIASPLWIFNDDDPTGRIYFISDHEGIGELYSARPDGTELQRHTDHEDFYARNPSTDGRRIVYHAGADIFVYDIASGESHKVDIEYHSPRVQRNRKFVHSGLYMDSVAIHPKGNALSLTTRGKAFALHNHEGAVVQLGKPSGVRYRLSDWLNDGRRVVLVSDEPGEEVLEIHSWEPGIPTRRLDNIEFGRATDLRMAPMGEKVALTNHRHELIVVDLEKGESTLVDRSPYRQIAGIDWSPDGRWLAYSCASTHQTTELRLYRLPDPEAEDASLHQGSIHRITRPVLHDVSPAFDPEGNYLYFISYREFNPVYDSLHFDLGFPRGARPYLITLRDDLPNPFVPRPDEDEDPDEDHEDEADPEDAAADEGDEEAGDDGYEYEGEFDGDVEGEFDDDAGDGYPRRSGRALPRHRLSMASESSEAAATGTDPSADGGKQPASKKSKDGKAENGKPESEEKEEPPRLKIDLEGIERRVLAFPVPEGRYVHIGGIPEKAIFTIFPVRGSLHDEDDGIDEEPSGGQLRGYSFKDYRCETLADDVDWFDVSRNRKKLVYGSGDRLRVMAAGEKAPGNSGPPRRSGWVDLGRVKVSIDPQSEWEQMFREAWRLQRDHFWSEDMSDVDWQIIYQRYFPLIERISCRVEFSDLMWEMQGELGTSHAYEFGGDYRPRPAYSQGFLGARYRWDEEAGGYLLEDFIQGDSWNPDAHSPLAAPGVDVKPGDLLVAINGQPLSASVSPARLLVNQAGEEVMLTLRVEETVEEGDEPAAEAKADGAEDPQPTANDQSSTKTQHESRNTNHVARSTPFRTITVRTLHDEQPSRYRAWVNRNRQQVHEATGGRVGYVHIPDMGPNGYAEFHRGYLAEVDKDGLVIDVRFNGGGSVSALILEKLARRRLGYDVQRWGGLSPYPVESVAGPLVALTNEYAGSDGDIFCHSFKMLGLGPLIGKRTWGGVIGIWPRHALVDGTVTTQPEFSFWFGDVGWNVENYGTDPDVEVDNTPQDYRNRHDAQLQKGIETILGLIESNPPLQPPDPKSRPSRALPKLPPRKRDE